EQGLSTPVGNDNFSCDKEGQKNHSNQEKSEDSARCPSIGTGRRERVQHGCQANGSKEKADEVEARAPLWAVFPQENHSKDNGNNANRNVDVENQWPAGKCHDISAKSWSKGRCQESWNAKKAHGCSTFLRRKFAEE